MFKETNQIINKLISKKITLSTVESCTGGMLTQEITSVSGASKVFKFGIVAYSNQSKVKYLKVPLRIIKIYGSVSKQCCRAMLNNLSKISKSEINIAITGVAGPNGGSKLKPVGLVYIGIKKGKRIEINEYFFKNKNRDNIRISSVKKSLGLIKKFI
jgi:nicotinamide-nucleotide amidase|tara:strand:+ start:151 stop:621 length:471 start_codon:yes stop_codon:yes gene_type:complete